MVRITIAAAATALLALTGVGQAQSSFPETIPLPNGFQPEGIAIGKGTTFYVGSIPTGAVYRGDLRTGESSVLVPGASGRASIGVGVDQRNRLFVAGGPTGKGFVYSADGQLLAEYLFAPGIDPTFVNDVFVTKDAAWFTDSRRHALYRVGISPGGGLAGAAETLPVTGDFVPTAGNNLNGIEGTPNGKTLIAVQSSTGLLFTVDQQTGVAEEIDLGGATLPNGDGLLLHGRALYVVQNRLNQIAVVRLAPDFASGVVTGVLTDPDFDVPTTIDRHGQQLYVVNARFGIPPDPANEYDVVKVG